jgi:hypothetical protein
MFIIIQVNKNDSTLTLKINFEKLLWVLRGSLTGQVLGLLPNGHEFESPQDH